jgi:uncharacterized protein involved in high-affinity Fe2+ transport
VQVMQSKIRIVILILSCVLLLSLLSNIGNGLVIQYPQAADVHHDSFSSGGTGKVHQNPIANIYIQQTSFYQETQQLSRLKSNNSMEAFFGSSDGLFYDTAARFISLSDQIPDFRINYFLISPNSPNAPPVILL